MRTISPPAGNGISSASAKGGSGGGIEVSKPTAEMNSTYTVSAKILANLVNAVGDVTVSTDSMPNESSYAQNGSGGAINIGNAEADITFTNTNTTTIGAGTTIASGGDFSMVADNAFNFTDDSTAQGGGFVSSAASTANIHINSTTNANIGSNAKITASSVDIEALISSSHANTTAEAQGGGLFGDVNANGNIDGTSTADVTIGGGGTVIDGIYGVTIKADQGDFNVSPSTDSSFFIGIGPTITHADNNTSLVENVDGLAGSTIIAGPPSESNPEALDVEANGGGGGSESHAIAWSTDVIIYQGASPWLIVDAGGNIVKAINVSVNGGNDTVGSSAVSGGDISVDPIANQGGSEAVFNSPGSSINLDGSTEPTFEFRDNFQQVLISNASPDTLTINEIDVIDRSLTTQPTVELDGTSIGLTFLLTQDFTPTLVDISNFGAGNIVLQGDPTSAAWKATDSLIENPIGETRILNTAGNIVSAGAWAIIRTNTLGNQFSPLLPGEFMHGIQATLGSIGSATAPVNVQLVQSAGFNEQLYADAGVNVDLSLTGLLRDPAVSSFTVHIDSIVTGGDASVLLQSSLQQTTVSGDLGGVLVTVPPNGQSGTFYQQFTYFNPDTNPNTPLDVGVFGTGATTIASTYDFRQRDNTLTPTTMAGVTAGGDIIITAANPKPTDPIINVYAITELSGSGGYIDVLTNGYITLMEDTGDLRAGLIKSTANNVTLYSPARIVDGLNDPAGADTNVTGVNITLTADNNNLGQSNSMSGTGGIGTPGDFLTIDVNVLRGTGTGLGVLNAFDNTTGLDPGHLYHADDRRPRGRYRHHQRRRLTCNGERLDRRRARWRRRPGRAGQCHRQHRRPVRAWRKHRRPERRQRSQGRFAQRRARDDRHRGHRQHRSDPGQRQRPGGPDRGADRQYPLHGAPERGSWRGPRSAEQLGLGAVPLEHSGGGLAPLDRRAAGLGDVARRRRRDHRPERADPGRRQYHNRWRLRPGERDVRRRLRQRSASYCWRHHHRGRDD